MLKRKKALRFVAAVLLVITVFSSTFSYAEGSSTSIFSRWLDTIEKTDFTKAEYQLELKDAGFQSMGAVSFQQAEDGIQLTLSYGNLQIPVRFMKEGLAVWFDGTPYYIDYCSAIKLLVKNLFPNDSGSIETIITMIPDIEDLANDLWQYLQDYGAVQYVYTDLPEGGYSLHVSADSISLITALCSYIFDAMAFSDETADNVYEKFGTLIGQLFGTRHYSKLQLEYDILNGIAKLYGTVSFDFDLMKKDSFISLKFDANKNGYSRWGYWNNLSYFSTAFTFSKTNGLWNGQGELSLNQEGTELCKITANLTEGQGENQSRTFALEGNYYYCSDKAADFSSLLNLDQHGINIDFDLNVDEGYFGKDTNYSTHFAAYEYDFSGSLFKLEDGMQFSCSAVVPQAPQYAFHCFGKFTSQEQKFTLNQQNLNISLHKISGQNGQFKSTGFINGTCGSRYYHDYHFDIARQNNEFEAKIVIDDTIIHLFASPKNNEYKATITAHTTVIDICLLTNPGHITLTGSNNWGTTLNVDVSYQENVPLFGSDSNWKISASYSANGETVHYTLDCQTGSLILKMNDWQLAAVKVEQPSDDSLSVTVEGAENQKLFGINCSIKDNVLIQNISGDSVGKYSLIHSIKPADTLPVLKTEDCEALTLETLTAKLTEALSKLMSSADTN